jgi:hypothetical protein
MKVFCQPAILETNPPRRSAPGSYWPGKPLAWQAAALKAIAIEANAMPNALRPAGSMACRFLVD